MTKFEDSGTANTKQMKNMERLLKKMGHDINTLSDTPSKDYDEYAALMARFKHIMENGGALLRAFSA